MGEMPGERLKRPSTNESTERLPVHWPCRAFVVTMSVLVDEYHAKTPAPRAMDALHESGLNTMRATDHELRRTHVIRLRPIVRNLCKGNDLTRLGITASVTHVRGTACGASRRSCGVRGKTRRSVVPSTSLETAANLHAKMRRRGCGHKTPATQ